MSERRKNPVPTDGSTIGLIIFVILVTILVYSLVVPKETKTVTFKERCPPQLVKDCLFHDPCEWVALHWYETRLRWRKRDLEVADATN